MGWNRRASAAARPLPFTLVVQQPLKAEAKCICTTIAECVCTDDDPDAPSAPKKKEVNVWMQLAGIL